MNRFAMMLGIAAGLALVGTACEDIGAGTGDPTTCETEYTGPIVIQNVDVTCVDTSTVVFEVTTDGAPIDGTVYSEDTRNTPSHGDEHDLEVATVDACGESTILERTLATGELNWEANESTLFSCEPETHFDSITMTYAFRVYDVDGNLADCLVAGDDVAQFRTENDFAVTPSNSGEITEENCAVGIITGR